MSVLSTVQTAREGPVMEPEDQVLSDVQECSRLVFTLASEAMYEHKENYDYFRVSFSFCNLGTYVLFIMESRTTWAIMRSSRLFKALYQTQKRPKRLLVSFSRWPCITFLCLVYLVAF